MARIALLTLILALPTLVQAQEVYGNEEGCSRLTDAPIPGDGATLWYPDRMEFHESSCPIAGVLAVGSGATVVTLTCSGEGETWQSHYLLRTTAEPDTFLLSPEEYPDMQTMLRPCR